MEKYCKPRARILAYYLPQFHPIPENDKWWGKGFTEWTNVKKAKPLFPGHYQPRIPGELGYYDLRDPEVREKQAALAREYGIEGFVYWHYWFGNGKMLLERPFQEVLASGKPDFPFALAWANESWKGFWHGLNNEREVLIAQTYPGEEDYIAHFYKVLPAFKDKRYITCDGKPIFVIYMPAQHPQMVTFISVWQRLAKENGLQGIYFIANESSVWDKSRCEFLRLARIDQGFDAVTFTNLDRVFMHSLWWRIVRRVFFRELKWLPDVRPYDLRAEACPIDGMDGVYPCLFSGWDHSPRTGRKGKIIHGFTPEMFEKSLRQKVAFVENREYDKRIVFLKSWTEWAEGNYLEPDERFGRKLLEAVRNVVVD